MVAWVGFRTWRREASATQAAYLNFIFKNEVHLYSTNTCNVFYITFSCVNRRESRQQREMLLSTLAVVLVTASMILKIPLIITCNWIVFHGIRCKSPGTTKAIRKRSFPLYEEIRVTKSQSKDTTKPCEVTLRGNKEATLSNKKLHNRWVNPGLAGNLLSHSFRNVFNIYFLD